MRPLPPSARRRTRASPLARARVRPLPLAARTLLLACLLVPFASAQDDPESYAARFDTAWRLVAERYWGLDDLSVDWRAVGDDYRPEALAAENDEAFFAVLEDMYAEIGDDHSVFVPPKRVEEIRNAYADLPCLGVFGQSPRGRLGNVSFEMLPEEVGVITVPDLASPGVAANVRSAVRDLAGAGAVGLVLDLRGNPGGRLVEMMQVAGVFTRGLLWRTLTRWTLPLPYPTVGAVETDLPLAVLIDGGVNSAAEGLAGGLQQNGRATVVGERSAGNVEAVLPFCLRDGSQAWIATGVLAPIRGASWEGVGVEPDIAAPGRDALKAAVAFLTSPR